MHEDFVVLSYPGPDRSIKISQFQAGRAIPRHYRNRRIGEFLKELKYTEGRSTGIPKIIRAMKANGSPPAEFEFDEDLSYFLARLPIHPAARGVTESVSEEVTPEVQRLLYIKRRNETERDTRKNSDKKMKNIFENHTGSRL